MDTQEVAAGIPGPAWRRDGRLAGRPAADNSDVPLTAVPLRARSRRIRWMRHVVQAATLLVVLGIGWEFASWVRGLETGQPGATRPPGVEAFLPISALMSVRHVWLTGRVHPVHPAGLVIFLAVVATGILLKKAFCSWLCPIGALSEALATASAWIFRRRLSLPRWLDVPLRGLAYLLLAFFSWHILVVMSPASLADFLDAPYNRVADIRMLAFFEQLSPFGLKVLLGLALASLVIPYAWCRYLCPYGALLGAASLLSPLKVTRHAPSCIDCGLCTTACPSRLPVARLARVRSDQCTGCLSCVAACPVPRALRVETPAPWRTAVRPAVFAALVLLLFGGTIEAARLWGPWRNGITGREYRQHLEEMASPTYEHP